MIHTKYAWYPFNHVSGGPDTNHICAQLGSFWDQGDRRVVIGYFHRDNHPNDPYKTGSYKLRRLTTMSYGDFICRYHNLDINAHIRSIENVAFKRIKSDDVLRVCGVWNILADNIDVIGKNFVANKHLPKSRYVQAYYHDELDKVEQTEIEPIGRGIRIPEKEHWFTRLIKSLGIVVD